MLRILVFVATSRVLKLATEESVRSLGKSDVEMGEYFVILKGWYNRSVTDIPSAVKSMEEIGHKVLDGLDIPTARRRSVDGVFIP